MKFITKDDDFGIRKTLFKLYGDRSHSESMVNLSLVGEKKSDSWICTFQRRSRLFGLISSSQTYRAYDLNKIHFQ